MFDLIVFNGKNWSADCIFLEKKKLTSLQGLALSSAQGGAMTNASALLTRREKMFTSREVEKMLTRREGTSTILLTSSSLSHPPCTARPSGGREERGETTVATAVGDSCTRS